MTDTNIKVYTFEDIQKLNPCFDYRYNDWALLRSLVGDGVTKEQISTAPVSWEDRVWLLTRLMPTSSVPLFAANVAESVLHLTRKQDREVCRRAIEVARGPNGVAVADAAAYAARAAARAADAARAAADAAAYAARAADATKGEESVQLALRYVP